MSLSYPFNELYIICYYVIILFIYVMSLSCYIIYYIDVTLFILYYIVMSYCNYGSSIYLN